MEATLEKPLSLDEATDAAAKELIKRLDGNKLKWSMNTAIVGVKKNGATHFSTNQSCHAGLGGMAPCERVVNALMDGHGYAEGRGLSKEAELWFVDYILNRSPYAETFITKDAKLALEQKYTVSDGHHPANLVAAGMVALRRLWEYTWVLAAAYDLAKEGVNEDLAFLLGHTVATQSVPTDHSPTSWNSCTAGHCSVNPGVMDWPVVKNFLEHKVIQPKGLLSQGAGYMGYDGMYGQYKHESYFSFVKNHFPYARCTGSKEVVNLNPFMAAKQAEFKDNRVPYRKAIEVMAEWAKTTLMEKINA
ncbi:hypothetical protein D3C71_480200 [compost metagenome]